MSVARIGVGTLFLMIGCGFTANAQGIVPGGWASQFGYQTFGTPGGGAFSFGYSMPGYGAGAYGVAGTGIGGTPFGYGGFPPPGPGLNRGNPNAVNYGFNAASGRAVNAVDPLIDSIRQTTRRSRRGR